MKTFAYTSRGRDGRLTRGTVQAVDRAGAMREVKAAGGVPLSVSEARAAAPAGGRRLLPLALLLIPAALAALWLSRPAADAGKAGAATAGVGHHQPARPAHTAGRAAPAAAQVAAGALPDGGGGDDALPGDVPPAVAHAGGPPAQDAPPVGRAGSAPAREREIKEPLFRREAEQMLALYVQPGRVVPPTPFGAGFEEDALAALAEDIVVTAGDSPEDVERKELVAWMKEDMRRHLAGGGTVAEFFVLMERRQEEEADLLNEARRLLHGLAREGDRDAALEAHRALNEALAERGIAPLPLPGLLRRAAE